MGLSVWLRLAAAGLWLAVCLAGWAVSRLFGGGGLWVRLFLAGAGWLIGLRVRVAGRPLPGPVLYVANHITLLDILALGGATPARFIAKSEIADWGLVGLLAKVGGAVFIRREQRSATRVQADAVTAALRGGRPVVLFGEGATGDGTTLLPFRAPLFVAAGEAGVQVQPVAIDYGPDRARYAWPDDVSFGSMAKRLLVAREAIPVTLRFLAPLDPQHIDRKTLAIASRTAIAAALEA